jgi:hypothetical protein
MGKLAPDAMIDAALAYVAASDKVTVCQDTPASYADATGHADAGGDVLAEHAMVVGDGNGDYTIADDATGVLGRKLTMTAQSGVSILHSGTATHIALTLAAGTTLRYMTTCTSQALTAGGTVDIPAWKIQIGDPT